jgi:hypothetical protein
VARGHDDDIDALIKVNRTIMEGLAMIPGQVQEEATEESVTAELPAGGISEEV